MRQVPIILLLATGIFCTDMQAQQLVFQFPVPNYLTSITFDFGTVNPDYNDKLHTGQDIVASSPGMPVFASADGVVMLARPWKSCPNWGYILVIDHTLADGSHVSSIYGHLDASTVVVTEGQSVAAGSMLGRTGAYHCWKEHLHFAIHIGPYGARVGVYPAWLNGYLAPNLFPAAYVKPSDFVAAHGPVPTAGVAFSRTDMTTGIGGAVPRAIVVGDFNSDGIADLGVSNIRGLNGTSSISVFLGKGDGSFGSQHDFSIGVTSTALATGDLNGDGKLDLIESHLETFNISVLLGDGLGAFGSPTDFSLGSGSDHIITGDFNQDGRLDVVSDTSFGMVAVLPGRGDGTLGPSIQSAAGQFPTTFAAGDFNGDGIPDLAVANDVSNTVSILLGNGDGTFAAPKTLIGVDGLHDSIVTGDFNNDGKLDVAVVNRRSSAVATSDQDSVTIWLGNGDGTFRAPAIFHTGADPIALAVSDFNGDGKLDIAVANISNTVSILLGNGDGTFSPKIDFPVGSSPQAIAVGDFNRDGKPDIVVANGGSQTLSILLNTSNFPKLIGHLYIANSGSGTVSGFRIGADGLLAQIRGSPFKTALSPESLWSPPTGGFLVVGSTDQPNPLVKHAIDLPTGGLLPGTGTNPGENGFKLSVSGDLAGQFAYTTWMGFGPGILVGYSGLSFPTEVAASSAGGGTAIVVDPKTQFVFDGGTSGIVAYRIDSTTGNVLLPVTNSATNSTIKSLAIDSTGTYLISLTADGSLSSFAINRTSGSLQALSSIQSVGTNASCVAIDSSNRFVFVSADEGVWTSSLDSTGHLNLIASSLFAGGGKGSGCVAADRTGKFVFLSQSGSNSITAYSLGVGGTLQIIGVFLTGGSFSSAMIVTE